MAWTPSSVSKLDFELKKMQLGRKLIYCYSEQVSPLNTFFLPSISYSVKIAEKNASDWRGGGGAEAIGIIPLIVKTDIWVVHNKQTLKRSFVLIFLY